MARAAVTISSRALSSPENEYLAASHVSVTLVNIRAAANTTAQIKENDR